MSPFPPLSTSPFPPFQSSIAQRKPISVKNPTTRYSSDIDNHLFGHDPSARLRRQDRLRPRDHGNVGLAVAHFPSTSGTTSLGSGAVVRFEPNDVLLCGIMPALVLRPNMRRSFESPVDKGSYQVLILQDTDDDRLYHFGFLGGAPTNRAEKRFCVGSDKPD